MGNSSVTLQNVVDAIASMPGVSPTANPGSYATDTLLAIAQDVMNDLISRRFNWKWNSAQAPVFLTNTWQQDYPLVGLTNVGWIEEAWWVDINSSTLPPDLDWIEARRDLSVEVGRFASTPDLIAWMYNQQLRLGRWPGSAVTFNPLLTASPIGQNPWMSMADVNGNIYVLTQLGTTGTTAPVLPAGAAEGQTVLDGTCKWTVCSPNSQGFRLSPLPPAAGPVYEIHTKFQKRAVTFTSINQTLDPIPDDYAHHFRRGFKDTCTAYSSDATIQARYPSLRNEWLGSMVDAEKEGDREADSYALVPASGVVAPTFGFRDPRDPSRPY